MAYNSKTESNIKDNAQLNINAIGKDMKSDIDSLKTNIVGLAHKAMESGAETVSEVKKRAESELSKMREVGAEGLKKAEERVREKPAKSIAMAFAAGILANILFGRK